MQGGAGMRGVYPILAILATGWLLAAGCAREPEAHGGGALAESEDAAPSPSSAPAVEDPSAPLVIFLGDSLTAGLGLPEDRAYPSILERKLRDSGVPVRVVNAGVSGDTTAGGLARLPWLLRQRPDVLVVGLGANDALRGQPLENVEANLRAIVEGGAAAGARVLVLGMRIPTNYGPDYAEGFAAIYPRVAKSLDVALVPFLLEGVGGRPGLNQEDGMHPNARGQEVVAENVLPHLKRVLRAARRERASGARADLTRAGCRRSFPQPTNLYPRPWKVRMNRGLDGVGSSLWRSEATCTSTVREYGVASYPHTSWSNWSRDRSWSRCSTRYDSSLNSRAERSTARPFFETSPRRKSTSMSPKA